ncbi:MAG: hypothetical protein P4L27_03285 [Ignavibacteriaceae bacterium]|nr:hypothetical protein [Ignavibacteriaceae bacterium]
MRIRYLVITIVLCAVSLFPQTNTNLTGSLSADSRLIQNEYKDNAVKQNPLVTPSDKKSVLLAGILSGVFPGAGEVYVGGSTNYIKAGALVLIEAVSIYYSISYNQKGDAQTNYFQNYADKRWSVVRYAQWINDNTNGTKVIIYPADAQHPNPWQQVDWTSLNAAEDAIGATGFTHHLSPHGVQQYYELIGKYPQYARGWEDYVPTDNPDYHSPEFDAYATMRGDANALYKISTRGVTFLYVNHLLGILDAIWSASSFNKNLAVNLRYEHVNMAYLEDWAPTLHISYNF